MRREVAPLALLQGGYQPTSEREGIVIASL